MFKKIFLYLVLFAILLSGCAKKEVFDISLIPNEHSEAVIEINDGRPYFTKEELDGADTAYEEYGELDDLDRATYAMASIDRSLMPTTERADISFIHPTGWHSDRYDFIAQENLYNRCHLIARSLTAEDANEKNLITCTSYMNTEAMLPYEEALASYIKETDNHVLYRVTPIYYGEELVARGVLMEAQSIEDDAISFCVFAYNEEPGVIIDYATGDNYEDTSYLEVGEFREYIINTNTRKFHYPDCPSVDDIASDNKKRYEGTRADLISKDYEPCGRCKP